MKVLWNIINWFLSIRFFILNNNNDNFNTQIEKIKEKWNIDFIDNFINSDKWVVQEEGNWGSAVPNNISVSSPKNVQFNNNGLLIISKKEITPITGKGWYGESITRNYSSGNITSKDYFLSTNFARYTVICSISKNALGSWPAFWLFSIFTEGEETTPFENRTYFEIDGFEQFGKTLNTLNKLTFTVHRGITSKRTPIGSKSYLPENSEGYTFMNCMVLNKKIIKIYVNNILVFITNLKQPVKRNHLVVKIGDCVHDWNGTIDILEINKTLPHTFNVQKFIKWSQK
jgi:hypothetical protein